MNELLVQATIGARQIMRAQAVNANNLANASTTGFQAELAHVLDAESVDGMVSLPDFTQGAVATTGRPLDISINGAGWIAVVTADGTEGYSRRGDLQVDSLGQLRNGAGLQVLGNGGPVALPPFAAVEIGGDGTISIQPLGQQPNTMAVVDRIKLALPDPAQLQRGEDGVMRLPFGESAPAEASVKVLSGTLESSNVNAVASMVKMIDLARQFEAQVQLMQSADENESSLSKLLSMN